MSTQEQIDADEALARRLQNEEMHEGIPPQIGEQFRRMLNNRNQAQMPGNATLSGTYEFTTRAGGSSGPSGRSSRSERPGNRPGRDSTEERRFREERDNEFARHGLHDPFRTMFGEDDESVNSMGFAVGPAAFLNNFPMGPWGSRGARGNRGADRGRGEAGERSRRGSNARGSNDSDRGRNRREWAGRNSDRQGFSMGTDGHDILEFMNGMFENFMGGGGDGDGTRFSFDLGGMLPNPFGEISYEQWMDYIDRSGGNVRRGATQEQIDALPTQVLAEDITSDEAHKTCPICLGDFKKGEEIRTLPCSHFFHTKDCIDPWLKTSTSCPRCRADIRTEEAPRHQNTNNNDERSRRGSRRSSPRADDGSLPNRSRSRSYAHGRSNRHDNTRS